MFPKNEVTCGLRATNKFKLDFITSKIKVTPKSVRLSEKLQLTAALCNEFWQQ